MRGWTGLDTQGERSISLPEYLFRSSGSNQEFGGQRVARANNFYINFSIIKNLFESSLIHDKQTLGILSPDINISLIKMLYFDNERKRQSKPSKKPCTFQGRTEMGSSRDLLVPLRSSIRIDEPRKQLSSCAP